MPFTPGSLSFKPFGRRSLTLKDPGPFCLCQQDQQRHKKHWKESWGNKNHDQVIILDLTLENHPERWSFTATKTWLEHTLVASEWWNLVPWDVNWRNLWGLQFTYSSPKICRSYRLWLAIVVSCRVIKQVDTTKQYWQSYAHTGRNAKKTIQSWITAACTYGKSTHEHLSPSHHRHDASNVHQFDPNCREWITHPQVYIYDISPTWNAYFGRFHQSIIVLFYVRRRLQRGAQQIGWVEGLHSMHKISLSLVCLADLSHPITTLKAIHRCFTKCIIHVANMLLLQIDLIICTLHIYI